MKDIFESRFSIDPGWGHAVICPVCGCPGVHINGIKQDSHISNGNQGNASISFYCECGHEWILIFDGHKRAVTAGIAVITRHAQLVEADPLILGSKSLTDGK